MVPLGCQRRVVKIMRVRVGVRANPCTRVRLTCVCDVQMRTVPLGLDNIVLPSEVTRRKTYEAASQTWQASGDSSKHRWRVGELEFEALMRRLENAVSYSSQV